MLPNDDPAAFLDALKKQINDPAVDVHYTADTQRPAGPTTRLDSDVFVAAESAIKKEYSAVTLPTMSTGATDMAQLRAKGVQCYGIGPATDVEDGPKGFGAHSDQERILESELYRFVRFNYDVVYDLARTR
jgi:acetylornithine deacetylase/succinyl-diaminopimelate desuccinylase-like protein